MLDMINDGIAAPLRGWAPDQTLQLQALPAPYPARSHSLTRA